MRDPSNPHDINVVAKRCTRANRHCPLTDFSGSPAAAFPTDEEGLASFIREHLAIMMAMDPFASLEYQIGGKRVFYEPDFVWMLLSTIARHRGTLDPDRAHLTVVWEVKALDSLADVFKKLFVGHSAPLVAGKEALRNVWAGWSLYFSPKAASSHDAGRTVRLLRRLGAGAGMKRSRDGDGEEVSEYR